MNIYIINIYKYIQLFSPKQSKFVCIVGALEVIPLQRS